MDPARIHEGMRQMHFENVLGCWERSELNQAEAAELLGMGGGRSGGCETNGNLPETADDKYH